MGETSFRQVFLYNDSVPAHLDFRAWYECPTWYDRTYSRGRSCSIDWLPIGGGKGRRVEDGGHGGGGGEGRLPGVVLAQGIDYYRVVIGTDVCPVSVAKLK